MPKLTGLGQASLEVCFCLRVAPAVDGDFPKIEPGRHQIASIACGAGGVFCSVQMDLRDRIQPAGFHEGVERIRSLYESLRHPMVKGGLPRCKHVAHLSVERVIFRLMGLDIVDKIGCQSLIGRRIGRLHSHIIGDGLMQCVAANATRFQ